MSYRFELIEKEDPLIQLEGSKSSMKYLFNDLLDEKKRFYVSNNTKKWVKKIEAKKRNSFFFSLF